MLSFLRRRGVDPRQELQKTLGGLELPTFPAVVMRTLETIREPEASASDVADVLSTDPGMSIRLLKLVNSASYSGARPVDSVARAVSICGMSSVESLVLSIGVAAALPRVDVTGYEVSRFWHSAARRAAVARTFATVLHPAGRAMSFTAGLLQDMAIPLLATAREDYRPLLSAWHHGEGCLAKLERGEFGWDHSEVATWVCDSWGLPEPLAEAIGGHHGSVDGLSTPAAVSLVSALGETSDASGLDQLIAQAGELHGIAADRCIELVEEAEAEAGELARLFH